jgi:hypothetical protein
MGRGLKPTHSSSNCWRKVLSITLRPLYSQRRTALVRQEAVSAITQAVSRRLPTSARVRARVTSWDLWWTKWRCGTFSPTTFTPVPPANSHSTDCSTLIIYNSGLVCGIPESARGMWDVSGSVGQTLLRELRERSGRPEQETDTCGET